MHIAQTAKRCVLQPQYKNTGTHCLLLITLLNVQLVILCDSQYRISLLLKAMIEISENF